MLKIKKNVTLSGASYIGDKQAASFTASVPEEDPMNMLTDIRQTNRQLYWENRTEVMADYIAFQDEAYAVQQEMMKERQED